MKKSPNDKLTIMYKRSLTNEGYFGLVKELPGCASQGGSIEELVRNLNDAIDTMLESNRRETAMAAEEMEDGFEESQLGNLCEEAHRA